MTVSTSIRTPNRLILPNDIPASISKLYNGLRWVSLFRKGRFLETFGSIGVRKYGKFKVSTDFFSAFNTAIWEYVLREVIDNGSTVILGGMTFTLKAYSIKHHLNPDLFANQFKLQVPTVKIKKQIHLIWITKSMIEAINTPGARANKTPRVLRQSDVKAHILEKFPGMKLKQVNRIISFCIKFMRTLIMMQMNPTLRYNRTDTVVGPYDFRFCRKEALAYPYHVRENKREAVLETIINHVKRNYN